MPETLIGFSFGFLAGFIWGLILVYFINDWE